ncbi:TolC family protein [Desertivirga arenae]|uniref:TolC family protein n=1 Tax=Desertivirga arenae TaxID=2810309 RepID=UPI001A96C34E|nr:TolC family protein [Pedobacter sp. SYSU D00823]
MRVKFLLFLLLGLSFSLLSNAQEVLTVEEAVRIALENNFNIRIASNDVEIAENNVNRANAGMLPSITGNFSNNNTIQTGSQTRATGEVNTTRNGHGSNRSYGAVLNWTIFDGFRMFARYEQLKELEKLGEANLQLTVLTNVGEVIRRYYELVQQKQQLKAYDTAVAISRLRVNTAQTRFEIGKSARLEVLNAQVDFNTDTTNLLREQELYRNTQIALNELMGRPVDLTFSVIDEVPVDQKLSLTDLRAVASQQSPSLQAALVSRRIAELDLKQVKADRYPVIGLNTGYTNSRNKAALGFSTLNTNRGFNYGITASINIFNGFLQKRNERNAAIAIESADLDYQRIKQSVNSQLASAFQSYQTNLSLLQLELSNQKIARQNLDITLAKYRLGSITQVEIRDAQLNYLNATVRLNTAIAQAKQSEISLLEISGNLNLKN